MSKKNINPRTLAQAEKIAGFHCKEVEEMAKDLGKQMVSDQVVWLDSVMKDLLPPDLYEAGKLLERTEDIDAYVKKHGIAVIFIPDSLRIRVMFHGEPHAEFKPQFTVDGVPVKIDAETPLDGSQN